MIPLLAPIDAILGITIPRPQRKSLFLQHLFTIQPHLQLAITPFQRIPRQRDIMSRIDCEIGAVGPDRLPLCAGRFIADRETGGEDFVKAEVEGDVLVRRGVYVSVVVLPVKSRERTSLVSNLQPAKLSLGKSRPNIPLKNNKMLMHIAETELVSHIVMLIRGVWALALDFCSAKRRVSVVVEGRFAGGIGAWFDVDGRVSRAGNIADTFKLAFAEVRGGGRGGVVD